MELSLLSRGILTRLADPFLRNCPETAGKSLAARRVELDKSEGVVKTDFFAAMLCSTAWISERWRTEALKLSR